MRPIDGLFSSMSAGFSSPPIAEDKKPSTEIEKCRQQREELFASRRSSSTLQQLQTSPHNSSTNALSVKKIAIQNSGNLRNQQALYQLGLINSQVDLESSKDAFKPCERWYQNIQVNAERKEMFKVSGLVKHLENSKKIWEKSFSQLEKSLNQFQQTSTSIESGFSNEFISHAKQLRKHGEKLLEYLNIIFPEDKNQVEHLGRSLVTLKEWKDAIPSELFSRKKITGGTTTYPGNNRQWEKKEELQQALGNIYSKPTVHLSVAPPFTEEEEEEIMKSQIKNR